MTVTAQCDVGPLQSVYVKPVEASFVSQARIENQHRSLHYLSAPDFARACVEHDAFCSLLESLGAEVRRFAGGSDDTLDSLYARDASVVTDAGVVLCRMGKSARRTEPASQRRDYERDGVPVLGEISGDGLLEGGDVTWLDPATLLVGEGYRTNAQGIAQLRTLLAGVDVVSVPLPHYQGPEAVLHLMSLISPVDRDLAVVYSPLMPVTFRSWLIERGIELIEVPDEEFATLGGNVLAVAPRVCVMAEGNPATRARLEAAGATVHEFAGEHICKPGEGGPTCLTRPLYRMRF